VININQPHKDTLRISGEEIKRRQREYDSEVIFQISKIITEGAEHITVKKVFEFILASIKK
jgi:hypothetical protein